MSSCYLNTFDDSIDGIFDGIWQEARKSKFAGGLGFDITNFRARGSYIKGTNGINQGPVYFWKLYNDMLVAVNQGGKRKGAGCAYLETWHADIEDFLALRKAVGDDRMRCHDMNTANWIPDLFMKQVEADGAGICLVQTKHLSCTKFLVKNLKRSIGNMLKKVKKVNLVFFVK